MEFLKTLYKPVMTTTTSKRKMSIMELIANRKELMTSAYQPTTTPQLAQSASGNRQGDI